MGNQSLRIAQRAPATSATQRSGRLGALLLGAGQITSAALSGALTQQAFTGAALGEILCAQGAISEEALFDALAVQFGTIRVDLTRVQPDMRLIDRLGAGFCAAHGVFPLARAGALTVIATCEPQRFHLIAPFMEQHLGRLSMVLCRRADLHLVLNGSRKRHLALAAASRSPKRESCRSLGAQWLTRGGIAMLCALALALSAAPIWAFSALTLLALGVLTVNTVFVGLMGALWLHDRRRTRPTVSPPPLRPVPVSLLVPLLKERQIAQHLVRRLARIDYPVEQIEILLVVEEDDAVTRATLAACDLPATMRILTVPRGGVQTKPRALNFALDFCRGSIVGVYDAEDAPDPGQIAAVVRQFTHSVPQVACLQGRLDYYNPHTNWLSRCFTVEYATWFRVMLPGMARLGLALPLGGTTLFFRKSALIALGGWDAHNVTEDADLGLRLARRGFRTDLLNSDTQEEANCRAWPWVRQRSRWIKGYAMTYFVHMRDPAALWRDLGPRRFWGMQVLFLGSLLGVLTAPLLWAFAIMLVGLAHPWAPVLDGAAGTGLAAGMAGATMVHWAVWAMGVWARGDRGLLVWVPTLSLYHALATAAALKAAFEIVTRPFFWDKTSHGHSPEPTTDLEFTTNGARRPVLAQIRAHGA